MRFFGPNTDAIVTATIATFVVLGVGGMLTDVGPWYASLRKPSWQPPGWLFAPAWTVIGALTATAAVLGWDHAGTTAERGVIIALFALNGVLNTGWSLLFFKLRRPDWALVEVTALWLSVLALVVGMAPISSGAAMFLVPYLLWVAFAALLNQRVVQLNRPFGQSPGGIIKSTELGS